MLRHVKIVYAINIMIIQSLLAYLLRLVDTGFYCIVWWLC